MEFTEAEMKQVRDTLNKQNRLVLMYQMKAITGSVPANVLGALAASTEQVAQVVIADSGSHDAATLKAATKLQGSMMVMQMLYAKAVEAEEAAAKAAKKAAPKKAAKAAKKS